MKIIKTSLVLSFLLAISSMAFSQVIEKPGESTVVGAGESLLSENLFGSYVLTFSGVNGGNVPYLTREETNASGSGIGSFDKLETLYSGRLYSVDKQGEEQVFIEFQDKTPEQLSVMEIEINPENGGSGLPPNIRGIIARRLSQNVGPNFPPEIYGGIHGKVMSYIVQVDKNNVSCEDYFGKVFDKVSLAKTDGNSPEIPDNIYNEIVSEITAIKNEHCGQGYSLFLYLEAKATSKSMEHELSDDSGVYEANVKVTWTPSN